MARKLPTVQLSPVEDLDALRQVLQQELNRIVQRLNQESLAANLDATNHRLRNVARGVEPHDAVHLAQLVDSVEESTNFVITTIQNTIESEASITYHPGEILTAPKTVPAPSAAVAGDIHIYRFIQDGTGGRALTWPAAFDNGDSWGFGGAPNTYSVYSWVANGSGRFFLIGQPIIQVVD